MVLSAFADDNPSGAQPRSPVVRVTRVRWRAPWSPPRRLPVPTRLRVLRALRDAPCGAKIPWQRGVATL
jgi:hypothetical protein